MDKPNLEIEYELICGELQKIIKNIGEPLEGNCVYKHLSFDRWDYLDNKRKYYRKICLGKKRICEIGFNAGHSILAMLLINPTAKYTLFDLGEHKYSRPCFEYLEQKFKDVNLSILWGDSTETFPNFICNNPEPFDLIHIDGSDKSEVYTQDWVNSMKVITNGDHIIFDDTDNKKISAFIDSQVTKGIVKECYDFLPTFGYEHRILIKK